VHEPAARCRDPRSVRRDLGRRLAAARQAAGLTQRQLAEAVRYSRSTVSNAEIGHPDVARLFWTRCDRVLQSGHAFTPAFDQLKAAERATVPPPDDRLRAFRQARQGLGPDGLAAALTGYGGLGWPAEATGERADLLTGDVIDALEVPRHWGMLAASLWQLSQGHCDPVRCLPALPRPARALAVVAAGPRWYFLAAAGGCPWAGAEATPGHGQSGGQAIRWHARGGRIPAPPSRLPRGQSATWAYLPAERPRLAPAIGLVGLLGTAAAMAGHELAALTLPGGVRVVPAPGRSPAADPAGDTT
jgi:transcriptional regulator with XRE-family HTH domain